MIYPYEIFALFMCLGASCFFSGSEAALLSVGTDRAKQLIDQGGARGRAMVFMCSHPNELLTTILVGNTIANIMLASISTAIAARYFQNDAVSIATFVSTIVLLIFGEITPKAFGRSHAEALAMYAVRILQGVYFLLYPVIKPMTLFIEKVLGKNAQIRGRLITKDDIEYMVSKAEEDKSMDSKQIDLINSVLEFPTIKVKDIMVPRMKVRYIQEKASYSDIISFIRKDAHSRYPVCSGELENTLGFLHVKDLAFVRSKDRSNFDVRRFLKPPFFVYEHMKIQAVFDHMKKKKIHLALVKDENGVVVGVVTLEDIIEEIFGEINDEHDDEVLEQGEMPIIDREQGIIVSGSMLLRDLSDDYNLELPQSENFSTVAGLVLAMLGNHFPKEDQIIIWEGLSFELESVEDSEIKEIRITDVGGEKHLFMKERDQ